MAAKMVCTCCGPLLDGLIPRQAALLAKRDHRPVVGPALPGESARVTRPHTSPRMSIS